MSWMFVEDIRELADEWHPVRNVGARLPAVHFARGACCSTCSSEHWRDHFWSDFLLLTRAADVVLKSGGDWF